LLAAMRKAPMKALNGTNAMLDKSASSHTALNLGEQKTHAEKGLPSYWGRHTSQGCSGVASSNGEMTSVGWRPIHIPVVRSLDHFVGRKSLGASSRERSASFRISSSGSPV
jgi:hypothetical protein